MLYNFSFLVDGKVAGSAHPGGGAALQEALQWLKGQGFHGVLSLTEHGLPEEALAEHGLKSQHVPIQDYTPPEPEQIQQAIRFIDSLTKEGAVLVHCMAGHGRTGTILACHLVSVGMSAEAAIKEVRMKRPGSIETLEQEESVRQYAKSLRE